MASSTYRQVHPLANCAECPLRGREAAPTTGSGRSVALVSRSPGRHDVRHGYPFAGPSGQLLDALLKEYNYDRKQLTVTNLVLCETDKPPKAAVECCRPRLEHDLRNARTIIAAGTEAVRELTGSTLSKCRGRRISIENPTGQTAIGVATFNPAAALREASRFPDIVADFRRALVPAKPFTLPEVHVVGSVSELRTAVAGHELLAIDTETTGLRQGSRLVSIGFAGESGRGYCLPKEVCTSDAAKRDLAKWFREYRGKQLWHNGQFDTRILRYEGVEAKIHHDTLLLSYACDERPGVHSLDYLVQNELDWPYYTPPAVETGKKNGFKYDHEGLPFIQWDEVYHYNVLDCVGSLEVFGILHDRATKDKCLKRYRTVLIPAANRLSHVEARGFVPNLKLAREMEIEQAIPRLIQLSKEAHKITGHKINLNSTQQCAVFIYDRNKVPDPKLNARPGQEEPRVRSTDAKHREWIRENVTKRNVLRFVTCLHDFKKLDKLRSTYLTSLPQYVDSDGRIRTSLLLHGTETARLSSRSPNLQNIPRTSDADIERGEGYLNIRQLYCAPPGYVIISADYSQAELRTAAMLSREPFLIDVYGQHKDLHSEMAAALYGEDFTNENRQTAKNVNFSALYDIGPASLHIMYGVPRDEAPGLLRAWWHRVPVLRAWTKSVQKQVLDDGEIETPFGHKRRFPLITNENVDHVLKEGVNTYVQSTASDFTTCSLIDLDEQLESMGVGIVLPVHDSLLALSPKALADEAAQIMKDTMEATPRVWLGWDDIPFTVDIKVGTDWGHLS